MNQKPIPPEDWECCESECSPCVWDTYYEDLREWNAREKQLKVAQKESSTSVEDSSDEEQKP